jgi:tetratricopeptide (TPR) repeat protein
VWQELRKQLHPKGIEIVTVALDTGADAARPWIEAAKPEHPSLIDAAHSLDELLGIVNVPNAVWIDEHGMIVRPSEPAWPGRTPVTDMLNVPEGVELPPAQRAVVDAIGAMHIAPERYLAMLLDWAEHGAKSRYVLSPDDVIERSQPRFFDTARAAAHFELGQHLHRSGDHDSAIPHWREAHRLYPENWTYKRQAWNLESADTVTGSTAYEGSWLGDVQAIGAENYYPALQD